MVRAIRLYKKNFYSGQDWNIGSTNRLNAAAGLGSYNSNVYVNDGAYLSTWGATPDADTSVSYFKTCYAQCKGEAGVKRIAVGDYGRDNDFWTVHCYCLTTDGSGCTVDTALVQLTSAHWYVAGTKDIKVFDLIAEETCEDCPAGSYQDQQGISTTCKSCPSGLYQDQTGQISCESCSVVYVPNAEKTGCSYCAAEDTNFNDDWTTGCGPWLRLMDVRASAGTLDLQETTVTSVSKGKGGMLQVKLAMHVNIHL